MIATLVVVFGNSSESYLKPYDRNSFDDVAFAPSVVQSLIYNTSVLDLVSNQQNIEGATCLVIVSE